MDWMKVLAAVLVLTFLGTMYVQAEDATITTGMKVKNCMFWWVKAFHVEGKFFCGQPPHPVIEETVTITPTTSTTTTTHCVKKYHWKKCGRPHGDYEE